METILFEKYLEYGLLVASLGIACYVMYKHFTKQLSDLKEEHKEYVSALNKDHKEEIASQKEEFLQREAFLSSEAKEANTFVKEMSVKNIESYSRFANLVEDLLKESQGHKETIKGHISTEITGLKKMISEILVTNINRS